MRRFTTGGIYVDQGAAKAGAVFGGFETRGHLGQKALDGLLWLHADDRIVRPRHAGICQIGRSLWQDALVSCLDMCMSANDCGGQSI